MKTFFRFVVAMIISFLPGIFGVMLTPKHGDDVWYNALNNSVLTPDGWVFSVAWTILYALLGIALFLVMNNTRTKFSKVKAYVLFAIQMVLNLMWTYLFFGLHMVGASLLCLVVLIGVSVWMIFAFKPINKTAAYLIWPYVIWMCFALYLNGTILFLN